MGDFSDATYSVEDNKLRLYPLGRLDNALYQRLYDAGFRWAPKQELFVAPSWTPEREDLCLALVGEINAEQTTLAERAQLKAARLDTLRQKAQGRASSYHSAARRISERFAAGQPILIGHHSERRARRDQERMHRAMQHAIKATESITYWGWKAEGVEHHANRKASPRVRAGRIKTLLKELRDLQRANNHAHLCLSLWSKVAAIEDTPTHLKMTEKLAVSQLKTGPTCAFGTWQSLMDDNRDAREVVTELIAHWSEDINNPHRFRWIHHVLNRLEYERSELGDVPRYEDEIKATVLQAFFREHGAYKPIATQDDSGQWTVSSETPLPAHLADGQRCTLDEQAWRDLMQSIGYIVPVITRRPRKAGPSLPLINPTEQEANALQLRWNTEAQSRHGNRYSEPHSLDSEVCVLTQRHYSAYAKGTHTPYQTIEIDENGRRVYTNYEGMSGTSVCRLRTTNGTSRLYAARSVVVISDKPSKPLPIMWAETEAEAISA